MADKKTSQETEITNGNVDGTEEIRAIKSGSNWRIKISSIKTWLLTQISGFVKTDGSTTGATGAPQEFTQGVTSSINVNNYFELTPEFIHILSTANGSEIYINTQNGQIVVQNGDGSTYSMLNKDGTAILKGAGAGLSIGTGASPTVPLDVKGDVIVNTQNYPEIFSLKNTNGEFFVGDWAGTQNGTYIYGNDNDQRLELSALTSQKFYSALFEFWSGGTQQLFIDPAGLRAYNLGHPNALATPADAVKINGVKVYRALLTQSSTDAPAAGVVENTLGEDPVLSFLSTGTYRIATTGDVFTEGKTFITMPAFKGSDFTKKISYSRISLTQIEVYTSGESLENDILSNTEIKIEVYP